MLFLLLIAAVWLTGVLTVVACCRAAARADQVLSGGFGFERDSHEYALAA